MTATASNRSQVSRKATAFPLWRAIDNCWNRKVDSHEDKRKAIADTDCNQGLGKAGSRKVSWPPKIWSWGQKLHMAPLCRVFTSAFIICI